MANLFSFVSGLIFGFGLLISGMANPQKVLGFLSITQNWDPSLAFVMIGAILIALIGFRIMKHRTMSVLKLPLQLPTNQLIDKKLIVGAILFGLGWGLAGICPGPALVLLSMGVIKGIGFVVAMIVGMFLFKFFEKKN